ncbi:MAG: oxidative damage protection protein [Gemmatimonadales bacterium]
MPDIHCTRCGLDRPQQAFQPFPSEIGKRLFTEICDECWSEWLKQQQALINHYSLNLRDVRAREFLLQQMDQFLFTSEPRS